MSHFLYRTTNSALGLVEIAAVERGLTSIAFVDTPTARSNEVPPFIESCIEQLQQYFAGGRRAFYSLPLAIRGTEFQQRVWDAVLSIPFGETVTYAELARDMGKPDAARAVGTALSRNAIGIIIPCHRVVSAHQGSSGGYAWGEWRKEWLLDHERRHKT